MDHPSLTADGHLGIDSLLHIGENQKSAVNAESLKLPEHHQKLDKNQLLDEIVKHREMLMQARMTADP